jgi:predicted peptidase
LHGPDAELEKKGADQFKANFPFIVLSPQIPAGLGDWGQKPVIDGVQQAVADLSKAMNVDKTRVYATGLNEGGAAAWQMAINAPDKFAAIAPIIPTSGFTAPGGSEAIAKIANWTMAGDPGVLGGLKGMFEGKAEWKLTPTEKLTDATLSTVYKNQELYDWLLKHTKAK